MASTPRALLASLALEVLAMSAPGPRGAAARRTAGEPETTAGLESSAPLPFHPSPPLLSSSLSLYAKDDVKDGTENAKDDVVTRDTTSNLKHIQPLTHS